MCEQVEGSPLALGPKDEGCAVTFATFLSSEGTFEDGKHLGENDQELAHSALYLRAGY